MAPKKIEVAFVGGKRDMKSITKRGGMLQAQAVQVPPGSPRVGPLLTAYPVAQPVQAPIMAKLAPPLPPPPPPPPQPPQVIRHETVHRYDPVNSIRGEMNAALAAALDREFYRKQLSNAKRYLDEVDFGSKRYWGLDSSSSSSKKRRKSSRRKRKTSKKRGSRRKTSRKRSGRRKR